MLKLQKEVDRYLFETHAKDIEQRGFRVTHTAPVDGYVFCRIQEEDHKIKGYRRNVFACSLK
ncbi:hypothetical protein [Fonticella tunisiensis]|uniref:hypothetical protein n=1 Tax=Fonticella tunisiensis TaxID=1096341 RepID=UPI0014151492|nr:hypothetical protein [Fonticella tunisiensis]